MNKTILITASLFGILSIVLGAFGAHGLKDLISTEAIQTFETGVQYQMYHAIALLFIGNTPLIQQKTKKIPTQSRNRGVWRNSAIFCCR